MGKTRINRYRYCSGMLLGLGMVAALAILGTPLPAHALSGVGPVVGVGIDPDQFHFGLRWGLGELSNRLDLRSGVEGGIGDNRTRGAFQIDALYRFRDTWDVWQPYAGGGVSVGVIDPDGAADPDVDPGLNIVGGVAKPVHSNDLFQAEARIGIGEAPDLQFSFGWLFR